MSSNIGGSAGDVAMSTSYASYSPMRDDFEEPSGFPSFNIVVDSLATRERLALGTLNEHPDSHSDALKQLQIAKTYIAKVQEQAKAAKQHGKTYTDEKKPLRSAGVGLESVAVSDSADDDEVSVVPSGHAEMTPETYYLTPWWRLLMKRLPWLVVLLLLQSFGALILNHYDKLVKDHLVLNFFIPMMQGCSGNAGNQPGVMVTRALGLGQLHVPALIFKEGPVAIITAATLGVVAYLRIRVVYPEDTGSALAIAIALFFSIMLAVTLSILFSYVLHRITCCDPADGAVPLLSTVSDVLSILILMAIAQRLLPTAQDQ